jgi:hypothetical protein
MDTKILKLHSLTLLVLLVLNSLTTKAQFTGGDGSGYSTSQPATGLLPVTWGGFTVDCIGNSSALLQWETLNESQTSHFDVYRSFDGDNFEWKSRVEAAGNSYSLLNYSFEDPFVFLNNSHQIAYYALVQVNLDGSFNRFPKPLVFLNACGAKHTQQLIHVSSFGISNGFKAFTSLKDVSLNYSLYDVAGRVHAKGVISNRKEFLNLNAGVYYLHIDCDLGAETVKVIVF